MQSQKLFNLEEYENNIQNILGHLKYNTGA
jgi:hypothetical protein